LCHLELIRESLGEIEGSVTEAFGGTKGNDRGMKNQYEQLVGNLEQLLKFRMVHLKYNERRADDQITAVRHHTHQTYF
jgi:hypothetical protein